VLGVSQLLLSVCVNETPLQTVEGAGDHEGVQAAAAFTVTVTLLPATGFPLLSVAEELYVYVPAVALESLATLVPGTGRPDAFRPFPNMFPVFALMPLPPNEKL